MVPGPWLRLGLAGKRVLPGSLTQRLGEARLRLMVQALLARQQGERRDQGDGQSNLPTGRWAHAEEMEEELHRPPFRHQILLPIRRGEVVIAAVATPPCMRRHAETRKKHREQSRPPLTGREQTRQADLKC